MEYRFHYKAKIMQLAGWTSRSLVATILVLFLTPRSVDSGYGYTTNGGYDSGGYGGHGGMGGGSYGGHGGHGGSYGHGPAVYVAHGGKGYEDKSGYSGNGKMDSGYGHGHGNGYGGHSGGGHGGHGGHGGGGYGGHGSGGYGSHGGGGHGGHGGSGYGGHGGGGYGGHGSGGYGGHGGYGGGHNGGYDGHGYGRMDNYGGHGYGSHGHGSYGYGGHGHGHPHYYFYKVNKKKGDNLGLGLGAGLLTGLALRLALRLLPAAAAGKRSINDGSDTLDRTALTALQIERTLRHFQDQLESYGKCAVATKVCTREISEWLRPLMMATPGGEPHRAAQPRTSTKIATRSAMSSTYDDVAGNHSPAASVESSVVRTSPSRTKGDEEPDPADNPLEPNMELVICSQLLPRCYSSEVAEPSTLMSMSENENRH